MRRRTLLAATAAAGPAALLMRLDDALAATPVPPGAGPLDGRLAGARALYDQGAHARLLATLPGLIADAHHAVASRRNLDQARLSAVYSLASAVLIKLGSYDRARLTADRARTWAEISGSPLAAAAAARELAIVLRHQDQHGAAQRLMSSATDGLEASGLRTQATAAAYTQILCTLAYTAARAGQRSEALAMTEEARRAARRLPQAAPPGRLFAISPAAVDLYTVGVHWALGDAGAALDAGKNLRPEQFPTAERKGPPGHRHGARLVGLATARADRPHPVGRLPGQPRRGPRPARDPPHRHRARRAAPAHQRRTRTARRSDTGHLTPVATPRAAERVKPHPRNRPTAQCS